MPTDFWGQSAEIWEGARFMAAGVTSPQSTVPATVLVIDDSEEDLKYWSNALRQFSSRYTVLESANAADALNLCASRPIDCVVLDLDMPESGFHVLLELVPDRRLPKVPVIVLTHLPHPNLFEMAKHNGAQACLLKGDPAAAVAWLGTIPARFLPASTAQDPRFAALKEREDFQALFKRQ